MNEKDQYQTHQYTGMNASFYDTEERQNIQRSITTRSLLIAIAGLFVTILTATIAYSSFDILYSLATGATFQIILILELVVVVGTSVAINKSKIGLSSVLFGVYSVLNGLVFTVVFMAYDLGTIQEAFTLTVVIFAMMAAIGYFTKIDLTKIGTCCGMALLGVIVVSIANVFFLHNQGLALLMDYIVVVLFVGITAYDMQKMKKMAAVATKGDINRIAIFTGMQLYLDFINIFLRLLRIMGRNRN